MAHHARSGICFSGAVRSYQVNKPINVLVGGTERDPLRQQPFSITHSLDTIESTCTMLVQGTKPSQWSDLQFLYGTAATDILWQGTITNVQAVLLDMVDDADVVAWAVQAEGGHWLLDRFKTVDAVYRSLSVNTIARHIIDNYTNGGFALGYCPSSLGTLDEFRVDNKRVSEALTQLAKAANAYVRFRPSQRKIDIAQTFSDGNALTLSDTTPIRPHGYEESGAQIANHVTVRGRGSRATSVVSASATTIAVDDCDPFDAAGGLAWAPPGNDITYTGVSVASGPGSLTGVTGVSVPIEQGAYVRVRGFSEDSSAQTSLATALGGGRSGVARAVFSDDRLSTAESQAYAAAYLAFYKQAIPSVRYSVDVVHFDVEGVTLGSGQSHYRVGKLITASMTSPYAVSGEFRVQTVTIGYGDDVDPDQTLPRLTQSIEARLGRRFGVLDVLVGRR